MTTPEPPNEQFTEQVKTALENLYDFPFLNRHALASSTPVGQGNEPAGYRLRRELVAAIESLSPGVNVAARTNAARIYNLLHLHYVGGTTLQEAANDLGISLRQAYRDLRQGCEGVSEVLWFNRRDAAPVALPTIAPTIPPPPPESTITGELERVDTAVEITHLQPLLESAAKAVSRLADHGGLTIRLDIPEEPILIPTHSGAVQQILIHLLSQAIQNAAPGTLTASLTAEDDRALFEIHFPTTAALPLLISPAIDEFIQQLRFGLTQRRTEDGAGQLRLKMHARETTILIVDDNPGASDLLQRFLTGLTYRVITATSGADGLRLAEELRPDVILLDLMMPEMDGWELLQRLRVDPNTSAIPVVICSVIQDPELAYSLGASLFVSKPVHKDRILAVLKELGL